ncbi:uncharacterized protein GGS25DRAFT_483084 [Hypoxylon fragiforme]|uniref:uncharacterized protein n=1 Tax=Hypoxylon fragiforme TaxID=63214 RepID=UPI0020C69B71|nr:uncharacterized protein GGS25DRAFT_483084 [Hypoxylon fragiforme]KAI2611528.1 hypothetical protein GGS25DRAFT_483084 [Hypoxylon fragiforme]
MHRVLSSRWLNSALNITEHSRAVELPLFLCPAINATSRRQRIGAVASSSPLPTPRWRIQQRCLHMQPDVLDIPDVPNAPNAPNVLNEEAFSSSNTTSTETSTETSSEIIPQDLPIKKLPRQCRGCGALSQTTLPNQPGYFDLGRKAVRNFLNPSIPSRDRRSQLEESVVENALKHLDREELAKKGVDVEALMTSLTPPATQPRPPPKVPTCDRCHFLLHNHTAESIYHPSLDAIRDTLEESPYKYNHVYHVLDAADFPMSLLPRLSELLKSMPLRTKNRRSRAGKFYANQKTELSFVITRCDLLAPTKPQVDNLFPYLQEVLRDALGRSGRDVRLGNLIAVSSTRSWWTKELKEEIWKRGGAGWMVGKANVGKSQLFEAVFPKGRMNAMPTRHQITVDLHASRPREAEVTEEAQTQPNPPTQEDLDTQQIEQFEEEVDEFSLLPPAPKETNYPEMPLVSDLPGTTASPIRIPFGNGRGELIDLPGLERTGLEQYVKPEHRLSLIMRSRIVPEQMTLRPSQSLLLGGFIRITPREPAPIMLAYAFTPIEAHVTRTDKAVGIQNHTGEVNVDSIALPETGEKTQLAGSFELRWDVTKQRTGPLTRKNAIGLSVDQLPYRVLSTDILIEGVGWVEITAQVRVRDLYERRRRPILPPVEEIPEKKELSALERLEAVGEDAKKKHSPPPEFEEHYSDEPNWPIVDVYSPEGKYISNRMPMNGWILNKPRVTPESKRSRPRRSMKGMKKLEKKRRRESQAASPTSASF